MDRERAGGVFQSMRLICGGVLGVLVGIAALAVAASNRPETHYPAARSGFAGKNVLAIIDLRRPASGWSQTAYDLVRVGGWVLVILGVLTLIGALVLRDRHRPKGAAARGQADAR